MLCVLFKLPLLRPQVLSLSLPVELFDSALLFQLCLLLLKDFLLPQLLLLLHCMTSRLLCVCLQSAMHLLLLSASLLSQLSGLMLKTSLLHLLVLLLSALIRSKL